MPQISVLMSVYNEKIEWVQAAVNSVLQQNCKDFEFIIVIDNPDLNIEIKDYLLSVERNDERVLLIENSQNIGLAMSMNKALKIAKGEYIARMDADDISLPNRFSEQISYIKSAGVDMVSCKQIDIDENGNELRRIEFGRMGKKVRRSLPYANIICHPSVMIKRQVIEELGGYRRFKVSQDYDLWLRLLSNGNTIEVMDQYLIKYRIRESGIGNRNGIEQFYASEYQRKLFKERKKDGRDSFSEKNYNLYIKKVKRNIDEKKFIIAEEEFNKAVNDILHKRFAGLRHVIMSFFLAPSYALGRIRKIIYTKL